MPFLKFVYFTNNVNFKRLRRELKVWQRLDHDNIVRLCGIITSLGPYNSMVCPWIENGTLTRYLERQGASMDLSGRLRMVRNHFISSSKAKLMTV